MPAKIDKVPTLAYVNSSPLELLERPAFVTTTISTLPALCGGLVTSSFEGDTTCCRRPETAPNLTALTSTNPWPVIVTRAPPLMLPYAGVTMKIVGAPRARAFVRPADRSEIALRAFPVLAVVLAAAEGRANETTTAEQARASTPSRAGPPRLSRTRDTFIGPHRLSAPYPPADPARRMRGWTRAGSSSSRSASCGRRCAAASTRRGARRRGR